MDLFSLWNHLPSDLKGCVGWYLQFKNPPAAPPANEVQRSQQLYLPSRVFKTFDDGFCLLNITGLCRGQIKRYIVMYGKPYTDGCIDNFCRFHFEHMDYGFWELTPLPDELERIGRGV